MDVSTRCRAGHSLRLPNRQCLSLAIACWLAATCLVRAADDSVFSESAPSKLIVLLDGRVIRGRITEVPGGYLVEDSRIHQVLPYASVRVAAASMDEAYVKQRDAMKQPTAGDHLQLARWCHDNQLPGPAAEQLAAALKLEPNRSEARALLLEVAAASPGQFGDSIETSEAAAGPASVMTAMGVTQGTQAEFVRRVQPILVNRCGNARCHGSASHNGLKLEYVRTGHRQQRSETERNLAAVLGQLDSKRPERSRLLSIPLAVGGPEHRNVFSGRGGKTQADHLRKWVRRAARDRRQAERDTSLWAEADDEAVGVTPAGFAVEDAPAGNGVAYGDSPGILPVSQEGSAVHELESPLLLEISRTPLRPAASRVSAGGDDATQGARRPTASPRPVDRVQLLREILEQDRPDAFDPNEFNSKVHGRGGGRRP